MSFTKSSSSILAAVLSLTPAAYASYFGNSFSSGPVASGNFIRQANSTLIVPKHAIPVTQYLDLWTGMGTSFGDLVQALTTSALGDDTFPGCGPFTTTTKGWCSYASTLQNDDQIGGDQNYTLPGSRIKQSYIFNNATQQYDQYVYHNGVLVSTLSTTSGLALGWGTAEECQSDDPGCGVVPQHSWVKTSLLLDKAQPDYSDTFVNTGSTGTLTSSDGGLTWTSAKITIDEFDFTSVSS